jgi:hypothetical protein
MDAVEPVDAPGEPAGGFLLTEVFVGDLNPKSDKLRPPLLTEPTLESYSKYPRAIAVAFVIKKSCNLEVHFCGNEAGKPDLTRRQTPRFI